MSKARTQPASSRAASPRAGGVTAEMNRLVTGRSLNFSAFHTA